MITRKRRRSLTIRLSDEEYEAIGARAKTCGKTKTEFLVGSALGATQKDDGCDAKTCAGPAPTDAEKCAWNHSHVDHLQTLRRITVVIRMLRFMLSRQMNIPETEVNVLMQQFIEAVQADFPERRDLFAL